MRRAARAACQPSCDRKRWIAKAEEVLNAGDPSESGF